MSKYILDVFQDPLYDKASTTQMSGQVNELPGASVCPSVQ